MFYKTTKKVVEMCFFFLNSGDGLLFLKEPKSNPIFFCLVKCIPPPSPRGCVVSMQRSKATDRRDVNTTRKNVVDVGMSEAHRR